MTENKQFGNSEQLDDTISRQAALDAMDTWDKFGCGPDGKLVRYDDDNHYVPYVHYEDMVHVIKTLPSAQRWIPCKERLPEDEEEVIVSVRDDSGDNTLNYSSCGWYACAGDFWVVDNEANERVAAWMPLPKPYRPKGDDRHER